MSGLATVSNPEEDNSVTMLDVLQDVTDLEDDVNAVLGASDDSKCSYSKGYIRQALYACKTCTNSESRAALCFACSLHCHEGHDLVELYTKRHVRCDCGNTKFGSKKCNLEPSKSSINEENKYNQNYDGVYCICARPYPDPDIDENDNEEMLQCVICEDWYHSKHLKSSKPQPKDNDYSEMTCDACMNKNQFLWRYAVKYSAPKQSSTDPEKEADEKVDIEHCKVTCSLPENDASNLEPKGCCFWIEGWRSELCTCEKCKQIYKENEVSFLLDPTDSVQAYEQAGKAKGEPLVEKGMKALASLDRVQQLNAIEEYNIMKNSLVEYLQKFAQNKKVVREEDIKEFFTQLSAKKRARVDVPSFCR